MGKKLPREVTAPEFFKHDERSVKDMGDWRKKVKT